MTKRLNCISLLMLFLWPMMAGAQKLTVNQKTIDVGRTGYEVPVTATFELRNKGSKSLIINKVETDCGCTQVSSHPTTIGAGDKFKLSLTYDGRQLGHFIKQVTITSNGTKTPLVLQMKGVVLADHVDYTAHYPYDMAGLRTNIDNVEFDDVKKGEHRELVIGLLNNTSEAITPNVLHLPAWMTAQAQPDTLQPNQQGKLTLTLNSEKVPGYGLTQASLYLAKKYGERISRNTELPVSVVLAPEMKEDSQQSPRLEMTADSLVLDARHKSGTITLTNRGQSVLTISSLQMFTRGMKVKLTKSQLQPGEQARLKVSVDPEQLRRARQKPRVLMITNDPTHAKVVIKVVIQ